MTLTKHSLLEPVVADRKLDPATQALTLADVRRPDAPLVYVNQGFEQMTGYPRDYAVGRNCRFLQGPDTSRETIAEMRDAIRDSRVFLADILNYKKDGTPFWNRLSLTPVLDAAGETTHYIGIQSDITALLSLQERLHEVALELAQTTRYLLD